MAKKKFCLGMLAMVLAVGMMVVGCGEDEETKEPAIFFDWNITVRDIPSNLNGQNFTMSIIRDDIVKTSKNGVVADGKATANLKITNMAPQSEITLNVFGDEIWVANVAIKIGSNPQLVMEYEFRKLPDNANTDALVNGSGGWPYSDFQ
jgi:hypothetical protein